MKASVLAKSGVVACLALLVMVLPAQAQSTLDGAWEISSVISDGETVQNPQASLYLFRDGYYSVFVDWADEPRPDFSEEESRSTLSLERLQETVLPLTANSGRYAVEGTALTTTPMVAINPNFQHGGSVTYAFRVSGDQLTLFSPERPESEDSITLKRLN